MSTNLSPEQLLTALVLAAPLASPDPDDLRPYCAFSRVAAVDGGDPYRTLGEVAAGLGFSSEEAIGVMRGWDAADGQRPIFGEVLKRYPVEVARGESIGRRLHARVFGR